MVHYVFRQSGLDNKIDAPYSSIFGGCHNIVCSGATYSVIGGGDGNWICGSKLHSFIGGCRGNKVNGNCSVVIGGSGNTVNHNYASIFGNGLTSCANDTFHVSCLNVINTPATPGTWPSGTIFRVTPGFPPPPGAKQLYIM